MEIQFISIHTKAVVQEIETDDVAGVITAAQGEAISFLDGVRKYDNHMLCFYKEHNEVKQYIKIFVK